MKFCSQCGSQQDDNAVFCNECGNSFSGAPIPPQPTQPQFNQPQQFQPPQFSQPQPQQFQQPQPQFAQAGVQGTAAAQKGSKKKLIIIISAIAAVVAVTLLVLFLFVFKSRDDYIVGTWQEVKENGNGGYSRFYKDGTVDLTIGKDIKATYKIDGDTLIITRESISQSYDIVELTNDKMTLKQTYNGTTVTVNFTKVDGEKAEKEATDKADLKTANSNAKLIFTTLFNKSSDRIADGESVSAVRTNGVVSVESLKDSSNQLLKAVYEALEGNETAYGYVYINFDPNNDNSNGNYVQWSGSESGGLIGQYPTPAKTAEESQKITFGERYAD